MTEGAETRSIFIVGAGQLGSRHLQALKTVPISLDITVVDPSETSLRTARERYESIPGVQTHSVRYLREVPASFDPVDIAIIPSNSDMRRQIVETLLGRGTVRSMVLEKLLFDKKNDYATVEDLLRNNEVRAWVNCSMRTMPFYAGLRTLFQGTPFTYIVTGSQFGLITNAIHYIDHMAFLSGGSRFSLDTSLLHLPPIESKRKGFLELNGTLTVRFENGCSGVLTCFPDGDLPVMVEIISAGTRLISREWERKAWIARSGEGWAWKETDAVIPYQSQMTAQVVGDILTKGTCGLVPYNESMQLHLQMLEPLREFLEGRGARKQEHYPFT
jgi:predicted dehydrogenase